MKVPIDSHAVIDLDAPTLPAVEVKTRGRIRWRVWCKHCQVHHVRGPSDGHREAPCNKEGSPYRRTGYNFALRDGPRP